MDEERHDFYERNTRAYLQMDPQTLTKEYSPSKWSKRFSAEDVVIKHCDMLKRDSLEAKANLKYEEGIVYGSGPLQKLDIFIPDHLPHDAPIYVYIHGGYWQELSRDLSSFAAQTVTSFGAIHVTVGYDLAPQATLTKIVSELKEAISYVIKMAKERGSKGIYLAGCSAGGHLAAMMLSQDWDKILGSTSSKLLKGGLLISGVYDVRPLEQTYVNEALGMTEDEAWACSPWNPVHLKQLVASTIQNGAQLVVAVAENDSPEFRRQSREYADILIRSGVKCKFIDVPEVDHFDVSEKLSEEEYILSQELKLMMGAE